MPVGTNLWRAAIGTFYSCQPCFVDNSKWDILFFSILRFLLAMIFLIESVLFFLSLWIIFNFYSVIFYSTLGNLYITKMASTQLRESLSPCPHLFNVSPCPHLFNVSPCPHLFNVSPCPHLFNV